MKRVSPPSSGNIDSMESCANKRHKNFEDLMLLLECTVCQKSLRPDDDFHSCENSHLLCFDCEISLKKTNRVYALKCATCHVPWRPCKQLFVKAYLEAAFEGKNLDCRPDFFQTGPKVLQIPRRQCCLQNDESLKAVGLPFS